VWGPRGEGEDELCLLASHTCWPPAPSSPDLTPPPDLPRTCTYMPWQQAWLTWDTAPRVAKRLCICLKVTADMSPPLQSRSLGLPAPHPLPL
jgi:hypothetical protein